MSGSLPHMFPTKRVQASEAEAETVKEPDRVTVSVDEFQQWAEWKKQKETVPEKLLLNAAKATRGAKALRELAATLEGISHRYEASVKLLEEETEACINSYFDKLNGH